MQCQGPHCSHEVIQAPGGHRERRYCSDRCRMAASRWRVEMAEQARLKAAEEARIAREHQELRTRYPMLTEESLHLLRQCRHEQGLHLTERLAEALVREHEQARVNLARMKQERRLVEHQMMRLGKQLGYPALDALELEAGEPTWWVWIIDDRNDLARLEATLNVTLDKRSHADPVTIGSRRL